ncbi:MAG: SDR family oxidoreductase [Bacteroidota bacterium]
MCGTAVAVAKKTGTGSWVVYHIFSTWAPVYSLSKTTMNAITLQLAAALQPGGIAVNAMCPGWVKTDMGGSGASRSVAKGAETAVWLATEAAQNLTGKFFRDKKEISW